MSIYFTSKEVKGLFMLPFLYNLVICTYLLFKVTFIQVVFRFVFLTAYSYWFIICLGVPVYYFLLKKKKCKSAFMYSFFGALIGLLCYLSMYLPIYIQSPSAFSEIVFNSYKLIVFCVVYGLICSITLWYQIRNEI